MTTSICDCRTAMKHVLWEEVKGKMRAFVALQGSYPACTGHTDTYTEINDLTEAFIKKVEGEGLNE